MDLSHIYIQIQKHKGNSKMKSLIELECNNTKGMEFKTRDCILEGNSIVYVVHQFPICGTVTYHTHGHSL